MWRGLCREEACRAPLLYLDYQETVICYACGQEQLTNQLIYIIPYVESKYSFVPKNYELPARTPELVKVHGMTNYHQKLISPLLTTQRVDKNARPPHQIGFLTSSGTLDCRMFGDKCFRLDIRYIRVKGYGMDETAHAYLSDTLNFTKPFNNNRVTMVALQTDGDGHCLVHAVSRALIGTQLFWHPLRIGLLHHFNDHIDKYKTLLGMFIDNAEWGAIVEECDPEWKPTDGTMLGLRNVHIFGLANLLRRPIILLDCMAGINASADYAGVFLPGLNPPNECTTDGQPNPPIVLAWASSARNHYVPLVPFRDTPLPRYPRDLLPKVWAFPQHFLDSYVKFDDQNCLVMGNGHDLTDAYVRQLANILDEQFLNLHGILPSLVSDLYYYHYTRKLLCTPKAEAMTEVAASMMKERRLLRCLACRAMCVIPINSQWLRPGGHLYENAKKHFGSFKPHFPYAFHSYGISCIYDEEKDMLVINSHSVKTPCSFCQCARLRRIAGDGSIMYRNDDTTFNIVEDINKCRCKCGFKHYWAGMEYNNPPIEIPVNITLYDLKVSDSIIWFRDETEEELNSTVLDVATKILSTHYSGTDKTASPELLESIVDQLKQVTSNFTSSDYDVKGDLEPEEGNERESRKREAEGSLAGESPPTKFSPVEETGEKSKRDEEEGEDSDREEVLCATPIRCSGRDPGDSYEETSSTQSAESGRSSMSDDTESKRANLVSPPLDLIPVRSSPFEEPMDTEKPATSKGSDKSAKDKFESAYYLTWDSKEDDCIVAWERKPGNTSDSKKASLEETNVPSTSKTCSNIEADQPSGYQFRPEEKSDLSKSNVKTDRSLDCQLIPVEKSKVSTSNVTSDITSDKTNDESSDKTNDKFIDKTEDKTSDKDTPNSPPQTDKPPSTSRVIEKC